MTETVAFVGATGGAGTTTTVVEFAAALARDGRTVRILDAAYATQGLARYVEGRIDTDVTALCVSDESGSERAGDLDTGTFDLDLDVPGRVAVTPADAPFERLARAKTTTAARRFQTLCRDASRDADFVLLDVPPVAANQHVAAVVAADRVVAVTPGDDRGADALRQLRDRLADIDTALDSVVSTRAEITPAHAVLPDAPTGVADDPTALGEDESAATVVATTETILDTDLEIKIDTDSVIDEIRGRLDRSDGEAEGEDETAERDGKSEAAAGEGSLLETEPPDGDEKRNDSEAADDAEDGAGETPGDTDSLADDTDSLADDTDSLADDAE
jgi:septum site-determining protein MinD